VTVRSPFDVGTSSVIHLGSTAPRPNRARAVTGDV
jgi:hypothetical protein